MVYFVNIQTLFVPSLIFRRSYDVISVAVSVPYHEHNRPGGLSCAEKKKNLRLGRYRASFVNISGEDELVSVFKENTDTDILTSPGNMKYFKLNNANFAKLFPLKDMNM